MQNGDAPYGQRGTINHTQWIDLASAACEDAGVTQNAIDIITTWEQTFTDSDHFRHNAVFRLSDQRFSTRHKDELLEFLHGEARDWLDGETVLTHADLSHAHIYIVQAAVSGWIDWAEAMLGAPEWDIAFHWFWTFSQDRDTMRACLNSYYQTRPRPDQLARRCFATHLYTFSMTEVWDYFTQPVPASESIVEAMITALFPPDVFALT